MSLTRWTPGCPCCGCRCTYRDNRMDWTRGSWETQSYGPATFSHAADVVADRGTDLKCSCTVTAEKPPCGELNYEFTNAVGTDPSRTWHLFVFDNFIWYPNGVDVVFDLKVDCSLRSSRATFVRNYEETTVERTEPIGNRGTFELCAEQDGVRVIVPGGGGITADCQSDEWARSRRYGVIQEDGRVGIGDGVLGPGTLTYAWQPWPTGSLDGPYIKRYLFDMSSGAPPITFGLGFFIGYAGYDPAIFYGPPGAPVSGRTKHWLDNYCLVLDPPSPSPI